MVDIFEQHAKVVIENIARHKTKDKEQSTYIVLHKMLKEIIKFYRTPQNIDLIKGKKITLDNRLWLVMSTKQIFQKHSSVAHFFSQQLKKEKVITGKSLLYPKNFKFISANPLSSCFVHGKFDFYDTVLDYRDEIIEDLLSADTVSDEFVLKLFMYLRVFHLEQIPLKNFKFLSRSNYYKINSKRLFIFVDEKVGKYQPIQMCFIDSKIVQIFDKVYDGCEDNNLFSIVDHIFVDNFDRYEESIRKLLHTKIRNMSFFEIRRLIQLEYQLHHSSLELTFMLSKKHPRLSVAEINYLYPNEKLNDLLVIEKNNVEIYRHMDNSEGDEVEEESVNVVEYFSKNLELYDQLKKIVNTPLEEKEFQLYLKEWYKFFELHLDSEEGFILHMLQFSSFLLNKSGPSAVNKPIKAKTLKEYFRIIFQYAFKHIMIEGEINEEAIKNIELGIIYNDHLSIPTQRKYKRVINLFLKNTTNNSTLQRVETRIDIRRSIVFKNEIDKVLGRLVDEETKELTRVKSKIFLITYRKVVFMLLLYYSGCRKNELRSRLTKDMIAIPQKDFILYLNKTGINMLKKREGDLGQDLKTWSAKRKIRFTVSDKRHHEIISKYLRLVEKYGYVFLFPGYTETSARKKHIEDKILSKKNVISESSLSRIGELLQEVTLRYTPLHALRHSYATNKIKYLCESEEDRIEDMFEVSTQMGHNGPGVTIDHYGHLDLLKIEGVIDF